MFFFFKQKTAYEMRISDWSSDGALPIYHQDQRRRRGSLDDRGTRAHLRRPESGDRGVQGGRARPRRRRRRPLPGPARQRHARTAQADSAARRAAGQGLSRRLAHRRAHVGRERQGANGDPLVAGSRSEEHTYELQSLMRISYAVFFLKTIKQTQN